MGSGTSTGTGKGASTGTGTDRYIYRHRYRYMYRYRYWYRYQYRYRGEMVSEHCSCHDWRQERHALVLARCCVHHITTPVQVQTSA